MKINSKRIVYVYISLYLTLLIGFYFHETYDPLLYFIFLLLINSQQFSLFVEKLNFKNLIILFSFVIIYYCTSVIKYLFFFVPQI